MRQQRRDLLAAGIAIVALTLAIGAVVIGRQEPGITLRVEGDHLVVDQVTPYGLASVDRVDPGAIVVNLNGTQLFRLPAYIYPEPGPSDDPNVAPQPIGTDPLQPTAVPMTPEQLQALANTPVRDLSTIGKDALAQGSPDNWYIRQFWYYGWTWEATLVPLAIGTMLLVGGWQLLRSGRLGAPLQALAVTLPVAVATPFLVQPLAATWEVVAVTAAGLLAVLAMIPLADALWTRIPGGAERRSTGFTVVFCVVLAILVTIAMVQQQPSWTIDLLRWALVGAIPLLPGLAAAGPIDFDALRSPASSGRVLQSAELAVAGATPLFAVGTIHNPGYVTLFIWLAAVAAVARFTVRPLARVASRAQLQRDLVVAATEAERARLAADIHDDALQELTLLVRRLEASGDEEGAELGRTVSERLRAILGDLRLPILDDLGVGPALDWLVLRVERLAGGEVRLERTDGSRLPADVELAFFRVAQEALANAVKHGQPPIVVRYRSTENGASLSVDDAGPGIEPDAGAVAERSGHLGLLNMQQRAEAIGAILDVRRWPGGGTHVAMEWRAP
jgi:signal transduction histidine kinase